MKTHTETVAAGEDGRLLDVNSTASYFGVSRRTVYRLVSTGALRPLKVGDRLRFRVRDLDEYLDGRDAAALADMTHVSGLIADELERLKRPQGGD